MFFFSKIFFSDSKKNVSIDARPSDAIAIAIRFGVNVYTNDKVMRDAGILFDEVNVDSKVDKKSKIKTLSDMTISELNNSLDLSISDENYEFAARIRDEIKKRN